MAIANEEILKREIKKGDANVYVLFGEDGYLKKMYMEKISTACAEKDDIFNYQKFQLDCDLQEVYDAVLQFPMMSDKKCVILNDYDFEHCAKSDLTKLCTIICETPDTCVLILWFDAFEFEYKKNNKFKEIEKAVDSVGGVVAKLDHRKEAELVKMLTDGALKRGCKLESADARYLIEISGQDINILKNELEKLCFYVKDGAIAKQIIEKVAIKTVETNIFLLSKRIIACDMKSALTMLDELFFLRVEPMIILSTISGFYVDMYRAFLGRQKGLSVSEIAEKFGYPSNRKFAIENAVSDAEKFDFKRFALSFDALRNADKVLKSFSQDERTVLEKLVVGLGYIAVKGESID